MREPSRSAVSAEAEARLLDRPAVPSVLPEHKPVVVAELRSAEQQEQVEVPPVGSTKPFAAGSLLQKKKRDRLLLVSFRMPQGLKEKLELAAKTHELNQTDIINEAIELNLQRYL